MIKRVFDVLIILIFFPVLLPVFIVVSLLVRFKLSSPVFFRQKRVGESEKIFEMYKFRSMTLERDSSGNLLSDSQRLTKFGRFLRSTSLDELPGLLNVLKGDMSLVGPRPLLVDYMPYYSKEQSKRHCVRPGITGWAQVNGRNAISWEDRFKYDVWYVDNQSFFLDIKILCLTVKKVVVRDGISPEGMDVMPRFDDHMRKIKKRIAVISDIHGNADALDEALKIINGNKLDLIVILGDLLTYGCQPKEVLERLIELNKNQKCVFIKGNHDEFYFNLRDNACSSNYKMPVFVKESVDWTASQIQNIKLNELFTWHESYTIDNSIFFAHANPFSYGNWTYVEKIEECIDAAQVLKNNKMKIGIFGHTHRPLLAEYADEKIVNLLAEGQFPIEDNNKIYLINPGSVGQPRGKGFTFMLLDFDCKTIGVQQIKLNINISNSVELIKKSFLSAETKEKLESYLRS